MQEIIRLDLGSVNAYLLPVEDGFILVDVGGYTFTDKPINNRCAILDQKLTENGCVPGKLRLVILTHGDIDHIANCKFIKEKYGAKIIIHKDDINLVHNLTIEKLFSNFKFKKVSLRIVSGLMHPVFVRISKKIIREYIEFEIDEVIEADYDLRKYKLDADILHLPGHTPGSIGILMKEGNLIVGDALTNTKKPAMAINACDFSLLKKSVLSLKSKNIGEVFPGHGEPFRFAQLEI